MRSSRLALKELKCDFKNNLAPLWSMVWYGVYVDIFVKDNGSFEKVQVPTTYYYTLGRLIDSDIMTLPNFNFCMHFGTCHKTSQGWIS